MQGTFCDDGVKVAAQGTQTASAAGAGGGE